ncbi:uncharacterized protein LOC107811057 isoform X2 [Nicotiana tabacum]|uniref:Uncharacterized protein LOC107811057 isoform X2 n=2 Tax=Nicotiana TaxID=4085 RepID=A0A1S4BRG5_TOBAC|nr:PREDICTED: uncharacterized protein LOC104221186 isoform X2 [Nicotiana sylvestris]XP_016491393.1 PREDICTED: uncharacterized protein LOC107811057 isoform X2 [Nicotiana tabacum]
MPPRAKRPKLGFRRMDAALDAMDRLGFSRHIVQKSIKDLLKVYGDEGWIFIEEAAYKLLIETILDTQGESESNHDHEPQNQLAEIGSGNTCPNFQEKSENLAEPCDEEVCEEHDQVDGTPVKLEEHEKHIIGNVLLFEDIAPLHSTPVKDVFPSNQIRKPCYGWISDDSDEDEKDLASLSSGKAH